MVLLIAAVQFVNILDFVMVMPMGPDFAQALGIPTSKLGLIGGAYTAAAAVSGLAGSFFLDRFDRRKALAVAMGGLVLGTAMGGFAFNLVSLMAARVVAGSFGGPATSLAFSIIADTVPVERRGKAMGVAMSAFAVASVLGVPAGLELAAVGGWRAPFFSVAGLGLVLVAGAIILLPPLRAHLAAGKASPRSLGDLLSRPEVWQSYVMTATVMSAGFILIPNISSYLQFNLGFPRARLGMLYLAGGLVSFVSTNVVGRLVDRFGSFRVGTAGAALLTLVLYLGFASYRLDVGTPYLPSGQWPIFALFVGFMLAMSFRNVSYNTLASKVPPPEERARFMSIQSCVQHSASALGAFASSQLLVERVADHSLDGIPRLAWISIGLSLVLPPMFWVVERRVLRRTPA